MDFSRAKTLSLSTTRGVVSRTFACSGSLSPLLVGGGGALWIAPRRSLCKLFLSAGIFIVECRVFVLSVTLQTQAACESRWSDAQFLHISLRKPRDSTIYSMTHLWCKLKNTRCRFLYKVSRMASARYFTSSHLMCHSGVSARPTATVDPIVLHEIDENNRMNRTIMRYMSPKAKLCHLNTLEIGASKRSTVRTAQDLFMQVCVIFVVSHHHHLHVLHVNLFWKMHAVSAPDSCRK